MASESSVLPPTCDQQQWPALAPRLSAVDSGNYAETESRSVINQPSSEALDWATIASSPLIHGNRFAALAAGSTGDDSDTQGFQPAGSRRSKRRRTRTGTPVRQQQQQRSLAAARRGEAPRNAGGGNRRPGGPLV